MVSLCYLPTAGRLTLTIIKARNLKAMDITGSSGKWVNVVVHLFSVYFKGFYCSTSQTTPINITYEIMWNKIYNRLDIRQKRIWKI
jgi:hypothetical protein